MWLQFKALLGDLPVSNTLSMSLNGMIPLSREDLIPTLAEKREVDSVNNILDTQGRSGSFSKREFTRTADLPSSGSILDTSRPNQVYDLSFHIHSETMVKAGLQASSFFAYYYLNRL